MKPRIDMINIMILQSDKKEIKNLFVILLLICDLNLLAKLLALDELSNLFFNFTGS
jgi:hypothetical protein